MPLHEDHRGGVSLPNTIERDERIDPSGFRLF
jgi:hypothetical protein